MANYLTIIFILISSLSFGQGFVNFGNTNPLDTARTRNHMLVEGQIRLQGYNSVDTAFLLKLPGSRVVNYTLSNLLTRVAASAAIPTLQQVLNSGNVISSPSEIVLNQNLNFTGNSTLIVSSPLTKTENPIVYGADFSPYSDLQIPNYGSVKDYVAESSFDTTMSATVTALTSSRFSRAISTFNYGSATYNSNYFTQNLLTGTVSFIGLTFFNGQKLTFTLR